MFSNSRYGKVLTVFLVVLIVGIIGLLGFLGYDYYQKFDINKDNAEYIQGTFGDTENTDEEPDTTTPNNENGESSLGEFESTGNTSSGTSSSDSVYEPYKGFGVLGRIEIPKTGVDLPILERDTKDSLEVSVAYQYGVGLNEIGNSVIVGHNYRNGLFFSDNKKLAVGDKIYITDEQRERIEYTIYDVFASNPNDASFYQRNTNGSAEITLSTCTDDSSQRIIIFARAE